MLPSVAPCWWNCINRTLFSDNGDFPARARAIHCLHSRPRGLQDKHFTRGQTFGYCWTNISVSLKTHCNYIRVWSAQDESEINKFVILSFRWDGRESGTLMSCAATSSCVTLSWLLTWANHETWHRCLDSCWPPASPRSALSWFNRFISIFMNPPNKQRPNRCFIINKHSSVLFLLLGHFVFGFFFSGQCLHQPGKCDKERWPQCEWNHPWNWQDSVSSRCGQRQFYARPCKYPSGHFGIRNQGSWCWMDRLVRALLSYKTMTIVTEL